MSYVSKSLVFSFFLTFYGLLACAYNGKTFLQFEGKEGLRKGKHIVLVFPESA